MDSGGVTAKAAAKVGLTFLALGAGVYLVIQIKVTLVLTVAAAMLASAFNHGVELLQRQRLKRRAAIATVLVSAVVTGTVLLLLVVPPAVGQGKALVARAPELWADAKQTRVYKELDRRFDLERQLQELRAEAPASAAAAVEPGLRVLGGALSILGALLAVWGITIFMLFFGERLVTAVLDEALPTHRERYQRVLHKIYQAVGGYLSGLGAICATNAVITTLFLAIVRVPFFLPLGILSGLSSLVPLVGNTAVGVLVTLVAMATGGAGKAIACAIFFILYQQFENHVLGPLVYRKTVKVNPLITVVGLLAFAELAGIVGAILAIPAIASIQIVARELLAYRRELLNVPSQGPVEPTEAPPAPQA